MKHKRYYILAFILVVALVGFIYFNKETMSEVKDTDIFDISGVALMNKLVFNLPNMDKQMCETFPNVILSTLEGENGVIDTSFQYDGHVVTVYYAPELISQEDILNNEVYSWVGTKFISDEEANVNTAKEIYGGREKNNKLEMPGEHMTDINDVADFKMIDSQNFPSIVSAEWLSKNRENVRIIEMGPAEEYRNGHVEGTINIEIEDIQTTLNGVTQQVLTKEDFETLMKNKGISNNDRIVIYSSKSLTHASRLYWTFKYYSHKNVAIVDGGKDSIGKQDLTTETTERNSSDYSGVVNKGIIADSDYVLGKIGNQNTIILDVRSKQEFDQGHVSGAVNIDWNNMVNPDKTMKSTEELKIILKNIDSGKEIIVYCVSGTRASYAWFVLSEVLGYSDVKLFDGSMIEWNFKQLPLEK